VVFSIQIDASHFHKYRAILRNEAGEMVWQRDGLQASSPDTIAIPVLSTTLGSGLRTLSLEGIDESGRYVPMFLLSARGEAATVVGKRSQSQSPFRTTAGSDLHDFFRNLWNKSGLAITLLAVAKEMV
jgi:hypothetical protein